MGGKGCVPGQEKENRERTQMIKNTSQLLAHIVFKSFSIRRLNFARFPTSSPNTARVGFSQITDECKIWRKE